METPERCKKSGADADRGRIAAIEAEELQVPPVAPGDN
jgi:hypothetical protein